MGYMSDIYYHTKYIKYKSKYFKLKNDMHGGATPWYGSREPLAAPIKCTAEADPLKDKASGDFSGQWISKLEGATNYPLNGCPDPSENYLCVKDLSCVPKCFSNADCGDASDCSANVCVPKRTDLEFPPILKELSSTNKLASMELSFKKREQEAEATEYKDEQKRREKEKNKEQLLAYNEKLETGTRRRGIKTKQRQELEEKINNDTASLKRDQDKEKKDVNKLYRQAINEKDDIKKTSLVTLIENLADIHREERERLK